MGSQPPAGVPSTVVRVTAVAIPRTTSAVYTGQSLPKACTAPASSMAFNASARRARSGPSAGT